MAAASTFTWNPKAVQLNGPKITFDTLVLHDYAQITFDGNTFADTGTLPIIGFQLNGRPVATPGYLDPRGRSWGAYIHYKAKGTQNSGGPATFQTLEYTIFGYNGLATAFSAAGSADRFPTLVVWSEVR